MDNFFLGPITRKEKVLSFIHDYYFGYGTAVTLMRVAAGPILLLMGCLVADPTFELRWVIILFAAYYILKPFLWVLFRHTQYQSEYLTVEVTEEKLVLKDDLGNESSMVWATFKEIRAVSFYYLFIISTTQRIRLPQRLFSEEEAAILKRKKSLQL